ncbi:calmodulin-like protein 5 [Lingula anatina]|uniref:Calmodulin-like protein 5 n=1 Tax=Lingula anatina TaxID=7574 RepID=A0A2R2MNF1_LINAN|nr:calmodulin-like protein 5 [Lingula anatina]|eukprot:XP_023931741.1 calmodulin-like protein 5 [Lingula anatina]
MSIQPSRGLTRIVQPFQRLGNNFKPSFVPDSLPCLRPVQRLTNKTLHLKKMPEDYPLVTGANHWRRKVKTVFQRLDSNADGYITKEDLVISAKRHIEYLKLQVIEFHNVRTKVIVKVFHFLDEPAEHILNLRLHMWSALAGDKPSLSQEEHWKNNFSIVNQSHFRRELYYIIVSTEFNVMDTDGDGLISKEEHAAFFYSHYIPTKYSKSVFDVMDSNADGIISFQEFTQAYVEFWLTEEPNNIYNEFYGPLVY